MVWRYTPCNRLCKEKLVKKCKPSPYITEYLLRYSFFSQTILYKNVNVQKHFSSYKVSIRNLKSNFKNWYNKLLLHLSSNLKSIRVFRNSFFHIRKKRTADWEMNKYAKILHNYTSLPFFYIRYIIYIMYDIYILPICEQNKSG